MSTSVASPPVEPAAAAAGTRRLRPHQLVLGLGVFAALFTLTSGVLPLWTGWHDTSPITREVFSNLPDPLAVAFYAVIPVLLVYVSYLFALRVRNWERGTPDRRRTTAGNARRRLEDYRAGVYMRTLLRDPAAGVMHSLIYFGLLVLLAVTATLEIDHQAPERLKFLHGTTYQAFSFVGDAAGLVFLAGILWAIGRRYVQRPYRIRIKTKPEHAVILGVFLAIGVTGYVTEMFRIAAFGSPSFEKWSFIGYPLATLVDGAKLSTLEGWHQAMWIVHVLAFCAFLLILPITMLRHMITSPLNIYLRDKDRPKGAMKPLPNLAETSLETFGANVVEDMTWKQLLDT